MSMVGTFFKAGFEQTGPQQGGEARRKGGGQKTSPAAEKGAAVPAGNSDEESRRGRHRKREGEGSGRAASDQKPERSGEGQTGRVWCAMPSNPSM